MRYAVLLLVLTSCVDPPALSHRPQPGAILDGPVLHQDGLRATGSADSVRLGTDRTTQKVSVPKLPRGGAATFTFGQERSGWAMRVPESKQLPALAYGADRIFVSGGFRSRSFYALHARTGKIDWAEQDLADDGPTAAVFEEDKIIFNTESCTLFVLNARTGKQLWKRWLGDPTLAQTAVAEGLVFAAHPTQGQYNHRLSAFALENGKRVWSSRIDGELLVAPVVHGDSVYFSTVNGNTYRLLRADGRRVWQERLRATTAPWVAGDRLYVSRRARGNEQQIVVSAATGTILFEHESVPGAYLFDVPRNLNNWEKVWAFEGSRPVVLDGVRYAAMGGQIQASDPATGRPFWVRHYREQQRRSVGTVAVAGPQVVISTRDGKLFGLDIDTGYTVWSYDIGHRVVAEPIVAQGWIYSATADGYVVALEVADRSLDGWHMFGGNPRHDGPTS